MVPRYWHSAIRHENAAHTGTADVSFCCRARGHGWMELKHEHNWPARSSTIVRLKRFTDEQKAFLKEKGQGGGNTWLLLQIENDHLLYHWYDVHLLGTLDVCETVELAWAKWMGRQKGLTWYGEIQRSMMDEDLFYDPEKVL